jgi:beta-lactam-binding protein with PASTA domain
VVYVSNGQAASLPDVTNGSYTPGSAISYLNGQGWANVVSDCDVAELDTPPGMIGKVYSSDPAPGAVINKASTITVHWYNTPTCP